MRISGVPFVVLILSVPFASAALAQTSGVSATGTAPQVLCQAGGTQPSCNGISVGMPKVFDNRSLTLQIEALQKALQQQQAANSTVDLKTVMAALANTQGLTQSEVSTVLSVLGNPTPSTSLSTDLKTGNVDTNGNPLPNTTETQTSKNVASVTPTAPSFDSFAALPSGFNPTFGPSASDLLNDQINLNYQIINLQMVLERALSDRLYHPCKEETQNPPPQNPTAKDLNCTRLQTVLGFNVTIDPPRVANDAVAVVEVTLKRADGAQSAVSPESPNNKDNDLSLVAVIPQEKTYNAAALSSSSHAYSGAAVVNAFQVSGGYRKRNQTFYVYRDTDTLAYERMTDGGELVFGWMFRPVLGRRSVSPGLRQLFAVVSLPQIDCDHQEIDDKGQSETGCKIDLSPSVRTYWKKYDRATQTSFEKHDANRARRFWYDFTAGLAKPQIFDRHSYLNTANYGTLTVHSSAIYENELRPVVQTVTWHATGEKSVVVSVTGRNFFTDTQVRLGDTTYSEDNKNLVIKSDESFDLMTTADQLTAGPGSILGRYGLSVPIVQYDSPGGTDTIPDGVQIGNLQIGPVIDGYRTLDISLLKRHGAVDQYHGDQGRIAHTQSQLVSQSAAVHEKQTELNSKSKEQENLRTARNQEAARLKELQDEIAKLQVDVIDAEKAKDDTQQELNDERSAFGSKYGLTLNELPRSWYGAPEGTVPAPGESSLLPPVISANGTAVRMPYEIHDAPEDDRARMPAHVAISASFPDSLITKGTALIQISWPFYDPDHWTDAMFFRDADDQFKVDRVSAKTIIIRREGGPGFDAVGDKQCWTFVAGDTSVQLATLACPYVPKAAPAPVKGKPAPKPDTGPVLQCLRDIASVTVGDKETLPSHAVLLAPDGGPYHLTIPDFPDKKPDTAAKPIAMKQDDSAWIQITLPAGKTAKTVEANGAPLVWRQLKAGTTTPPDPKNTLPETIEVEITRALTAKSGSVDVSILDASGASVARQTVAIACNQCSDKKGDQ
jgi:hypothetical protein